MSTRNLNNPATTVAPVATPAKVSLKARWLKYRKFFYRGGIIIGLSFLLFHQWNTTISMECTLDVAKDQFLIVTAQESGIIKELKVKDGEWIEQGAVLAVCEDLEMEKQVIRTQADLEQKQLRLTSLQSQLREQQSSVDQAQSMYDQRHREAEELRAEEQAIESNAETAANYPPELLELKALIRSKQSEEELQKKQKDRFETLVKQGLSAQLEVDFARNRSQIAEHDRRAAEERLSAAQQAHRRKMKAAATEEMVADKTLQAAVQKLRTVDAEIALINEQATSARGEISILDKKKKLLNIEAPRAGLVIGQDIEKRLGQYLERGSELCRIADISHLQANAEVSEWDINRIRKDNPTSLRVRLLTDNQFQGYVKHINTEALIKPESNLRIYNCEIAVENKQKLLRPGMSGVARISSGTLPGYMIIWNWVKKSVRLEYWPW